MLARRWYLLAVLTCSYGLGAFGMLGVSPLSPALMHGFALSRLETPRVGDRARVLRRHRRVWLGGHLLHHERRGRRCHRRRLSAGRAGERREHLPAALRD